MPPDDLYGAGSAGKFHCDDDLKHSLNYIKWFSPMAKTFCKRPPAISIVETSSGPRFVSQQNWEFSEGVTNTSDVIEFTAAGPPGKMTDSTSFEIDFGNCINFLELAFYPDCQVPSAPENIESGSISGGACVAYSFEHFTNHSGPDAPTFNVSGELWPYSVDLFDESKFSTDSTESIDYKD